VIDLSRYVLETLREDMECILYRGRSEGDSSQVLVLAPILDNPALGSLKRIEHEFSLRAELDPSWAARPLAFARHEGRTMLVLEDPGGECLDQLLGRPLELTWFLRIAIGLSASLGRLHERGIIHKDVKPANVLVDSATGEVWLTGFGIASRLPRERQAPEPPEVIAGTLAYMAPEQTGRMNRSIDSRSDLYAYGVTLYEMLTGALPFTATDPMEWIHCHIARQPVLPSERVKGIPRQITAIIMKLLAKTAEERYQTAAGVEADLRTCLERWQARREIDPFPLGTHDVPNRLLIPEKLYGREPAIDTLLAAFDRVVAHGTPELVLVSGYSGIGKSSVVQELHKVLVPPRGLFAAGKFDQYKRDIPYATVAQAFQTLIRQILGKRDLEVEQWRDALQQALGSNGQLIVNLIPELEFVIGKQPPVLDLPAQEAQNRFQLVFRRFLGVFARSEHPLALFLDDLQWLDTATLELLEHLVTEAEVGHLLLIGAYRDNEVSSSHPLMRTLETIRRAGAVVEEIVLAPLMLDDVGRLVTDALHCERERAQPLARLVHEKTGGNPFFAIQFFTALAEEGLLTFDARASIWRWDIDRIRDKDFTDNVVDLMAGKLHRLPDATQEALKQLACLGNVAEVVTLTLLQEASEAVVHAALWEAIRTGLVFQRNGAYIFVHDRVQEAAYALIPEERRAGVHLHIGRVLVTSMDADKIAEKIFDVVNQLNRGAILLSDPHEKERVAELNLRAGRKAKASTAYASACRYLAAGMDLLGGPAWDRHYGLAFDLWLERAECAYLTGQFATTEGLIAELLERAVSNIDKAAAYRLKILLHIMRAEYRQAVDSGLECLRLFGIAMPAHPTHEEMQVEYEKIWQNLGERSVESLIDLPLMTDREQQAIMQVLTELVTPAYFTDNNLFYVLVYHMVNTSLQYGTTDASTHAYAWLAVVLGPVLHRYLEGYRFAKLACSLVERYGFIGAQAKTYLSMEMVLLWTHPIATAIDFLRLTYRAGIETGDLSFACYSCDHLVTDLLLQGVHLDEVWSESQKGLEFVRKVKFKDAADTIISQQQFILNMRGQTLTFSSFSDAQFDEETFEAHLNEDRMTTMVCCYWILKLQARFLSGDYKAADAAAQKAKALLWSLVFHIQAVNYCLYSALTMAVLYETAGPERQAERLKALTQSLEQLREWAESRPETFLDKYTLVSAEVVRIEGRDLDAMRLYEQAIRLAREHGFVQNEGLANEIAARFYAARGFEKIAYTYLRDERYCYLRWGAIGKVRQLEQSHPHLCEEPTPPHPTTTIGTPVEDLDLATVVKVSQAVSGEIVLEKLLETLMVTAVEHAGAERGLLILPRGDEQRIEAEATTSTDTVTVRLRHVGVTAAELPESILHYVIRTRESVILDDASVQNPFSADEYIRQNHARSVLCLPLIKQAKLIGLLYLENNLTPYVFTRVRTAVLKLLASQAAISLENAHLYTDLQQENSERQRAEDALRRSEAYLSEAQRLSHTGSFSWRVSTGEILWSEETFRIFAYDQATKPTVELVLQRAHPEDAGLVKQTIERASQDGKDFDCEHRLLMPDGSVKYLQVVAHALEKDESGSLEFVGAVMDITERKRAEEALRQAQAELAHVTRVTTLGELATSIAHEINQPLSAIVTNGSAGLRWLAGTPPHLDDAREALQCIIDDGQRASAIITRIRALLRKTATEKAWLDLPPLVHEVVRLTQPELVRQGVTLHIDVAADLPSVWGDRVQLQQVLLNLVLNGIEALATVTERPREVWIRVHHEAADTVRVAVEDTGVGMAPEQLDAIFTAFYTTKAQGLGMGLAISRTIVEQHGGRLWAVPHDGPGATVQFTLRTEPVLDVRVVF
jgi:PAS domain S-box-containing protein